MKNYTKIHHTIWDNECLITPELERFLDNDDNMSRGIGKTSDGIYLIGIRVLNKEQKKLVYSYIYYDILFRDTLIYYLMSRNECINTMSREWGDYLVLLDNSLANFTDYHPLDLNTGKTRDNIYRFYEKTSLANYIKIKYERINRSINKYKLLYLYLISMIKKLIYIGDYSEMSKLINLLYNNNYNETLKIILCTETILWDEIENIDEHEQIDKIFYNCIFMVKNLNRFKDNIKSNGFEINEGPKRFRGQVNNINSFLSTLDMDYRNNLYEHYHYHTVDKKLGYTLDRSKFSFRNIHMNKGNIRWFSTTARKYSR